MLITVLLPEMPWSHMRTEGPERNEGVVEGSGGMVRHLKIKQETQNLRRNTLFSSSGMMGSDWS